jgi:hypothetical protein
MLDELTSLLEKYLQQEEEIDLAFLDHWVAVNHWDAPDDAQDLFDRAIINLSYFKDSHISEDDFRAEMREAIRPTEIIAVTTDHEMAVVSTSAYDNTMPIKFRSEVFPERPVEYRPSFAFE